MGSIKNQKDEGSLSTQESYGYDTETITVNKSEFDWLKDQSAKVPVLERQVEEKDKLIAFRDENIKYLKEIVELQKSIAGQPGANAPAGPAAPQQPPPPISKASPFLGNALPTAAGRDLVLSNAPVSSAGGDPGKSDEVRVDEKYKKVRDDLLAEGAKRVAEQNRLDELEKNKGYRP